MNAATALAPATTFPAVVRIRARSRKVLAERPHVTLLARMASELDTLKKGFDDPIDKAALREAAQLMHDVALSHDDAGSYGVYAVEHLAHAATTHAEPGVCAEEGSW